ncbi:hypothetical protein [Pseudanabaena sp. ABRG5-3]|uniref:hypothetical protein n=1 Tax=Pseudanabaena sp. ABRG5-3 TaxID=685565 RepID=UPI000DC7176F|nr:hypothetical protein [Pseudanabaena sp. ABRG5-3]BBC26744.1 hypothetical protein ABRG53_b031 [Pseudanabaena sp. ABRG5-3]
MQLFQPILLSLASLALLAACTNSTPTTSSTPATTVAKVETAKATSTPSAPKSETKHGAPQKGGQVIESGVYHLELVVAPEENGIHLDFFLQKGDTHEAIPDAKVTAQVQLPDGTQKNLDLKYDVPEKHYTLVLSGKAVGEYKVVILSDINGEKVNGRFNFKL